MYVGPERREAYYRPQVKEYLDKRIILIPFEFDNVDWYDTRWTMEM